MSSQEVYCRCLLDRVIVLNPALMKIFLRSELEKKLIKIVFHFFSSKTLASLFELLSLI